MRCKPDDKMGLITLVGRSDLPGEIDHNFHEFVDYYNNNHYHESLNNVTPADVSYGRKSKNITSLYG